MSVKKKKRGLFQNFDPVAASERAGAGAWFMGPRVWDAASATVDPDRDGLKAFNVVSLPVMAAAALAAAVSHTRTGKEMRDYYLDPATPWINAIPGVGAYNSFKRLGYLMNNEDDIKALRKARADKLEKTAADVKDMELAGALTWPVLSGVSDSKAVKHVGGVPFLAFTAALAAMTPTRTKADMMEYENDPYEKYFNFIPGVGLYNALKRLGYERSLAIPKTAGDQSYLDKLLARRKTIRAKLGSSLAGPGKPKMVFDSPALKPTQAQLDMVRRKKQELRTARLQARIKELYDRRSK